ncbi:DUF5995 family protein [Streptomyces sp. H27-S2]|uniref:DUF5995 family protein n=1 Tax=Streptomyces antarcticus TaxID=2996458 RepID=UPI00226F5E53|nr:DUF5995 family protein [Streptomyces sp. H27-S2]MCY0952580.1 DUF5995 family protein [Streptomyces sp. H27-S2]
MEAVLARMRALDERLPPQDGVAVFNRVYLTVTETLHRRIARGEFPAPRRAQTLSVRFAERYLAAVEADRAPACWRPLLQQRRHPGVRPLQHALAGINAHIGYDLAVAVVSTCRALDCEPAALEADFDQVGDTLVALEEHIREELMPGPDLLEIADPLTHLVGSWSLDRARAGAWAAARLLWTLRRTPDMAEEFRESLDAGVGLVGRCLLTPVPATCLGAGHPGRTALLGSR